MITTMRRITISEAGHVIAEMAELIDKHSRMEIGKDVNDLVMELDDWLTAKDLTTHTVFLALLAYLGSHCQLMLERIKRLT
jgi:hypothetical protein